MCGVHQRIVKAEPRIEGISSIKHLKFVQRQALIVTSSSKFWPVFCGYSNALEYNLQVSFVVQEFSPSRPRSNLSAAEFIQ